MPDARSTLLPGVATVFLLGSAAACDPVPVLLGEAGRPDEQFAAGGTAIAWVRSERRGRDMRAARGETIDPTFRPGLN